jgi:hypothetical protein
MHRYILLSAFVLALSACEKAKLNSSTDSLNRAVVESYLQPGAVPVVLVKKQIPYGTNDSIQAPVTGLSLRIEAVGSGQSYTLVHTDTSAYAGSGWQPVAGETYRLSFLYNGSMITAETVIPSKPQDFKASASSIKGFNFGNFNPGSGSPPTFPDPIDLTWTAVSGDYYLVVVENAEASPTLISTDTSGFNPARAFRSQPGQTNTYSLQALSFKYYGKHNVILYHLNAEYAALYTSSGTNSTNLTTPYTNVNGGLGIFTGVNADTLRVTVTK